eukprot:TRINITY_DN8878_c0_g1_i1.p1 TRINITY_DN8878_c0_g1~~TRINITY_DN8878_c0_g1_i1.p1  ORF type:complete len:307 (+),score=99.59 TRINITY_DN8878_c0_g1_i1:274-1194(+)
MLEAKESYGFVVMDGNGLLISLVRGDSHKELYRYQADLPRKHNKGGQSALRFARLRTAARKVYLDKVAEAVVGQFIDPETCQVNVSGVVLAGSAEFKDDLNNPKVIDPRIYAKIVGVVDVAYGSLQGLHQAIELASPMLKGVSMVQQRKIFSQFFTELDRDTGKACFGTQETISCLEAGAVHTLLVWDKCDILRLRIRNENQQEEVVYIRQKDLSANRFKEVIESDLMVDWMMDHYQEFGTQLEIVNDCTPEGSQFCSGFGGFGGILRYRMETNDTFVNPDKEEEIDDNMDDNDQIDDDDDLSSYF